MTNETQCLKCKRGYLIAEYSHSEKKTNYFCNTCFKYLDQEESLIQKTIDKSKVFGILTDEEFDEILDAIFNTQEN